MPFPAMRVGDMDVLGNPITGPGVATVLIGSMPASVLGDMVSGPTMVGAVIMGATTVLIQGRPASRMTSSVTGSNPAAMGAPNSTVLMTPGCPTVLLP